ncbi:unnamed protein product [Orchesella dallaii]|uniref:Ion transport domain-containing protein n=1 Tax=Orchesella dallaii TaxID=48710 RepID=A0ABP1S5E7_9HEXA
MTTEIKNLFIATESGSVNAVSDLLHELTQRPETSLRTLVNQRNEQNQTTLHVSCSKLHADITQILLEAGADPNVQDVDGRTPTFLVITRLQDCSCEDCTKKAIRCLSILAYHGGSLDIPNSVGVTPLYLCAEYRFTECAKALLENGAALGTAKGKPMIEILVEKIPAVLETVFDNAVKVKDHKSVHDSELELTFDLGVILPPQITLSNQLNNSNGTMSMNQVFPAEKWFGQNYEPCEEMAFLKQLLNCSETDATTYRNLLRHPIVNVFTDIKWRSLEKIFYFFLLMQLKVLFAYSLFICVTIFLDCPYDLYLKLQQGLDKIESKLPSHNFNASDIINPDALCEIGILSKILSVFVTTCTLMVFLKEVQHAVYDLKEYLKDIFNYFQLVGYGSVIYTVIIAWDHNSPLYSYLYPVAAFGVTVSWCQVFVQIGRLPQVAIYVEMFVKISVNFCWSLIMYSCLLIGFAMSFSILFPAKPRLRDLPLSMIQVLTMMIGELNYDGLFHDVEDGEDANVDTAAKNDSIKYSLHHRFSGHVWYVTFIVFITLVLMNLLVGLAVNDIQGIRKNAEIYVIKRRIRYIAYLEKSFFEATAFIPSIVKKFLRENVVIAKPSKPSNNFLCCLNFLCTPVELKNCKLTTRPNDPSNKILTTESKTSIKHWFLSKPFGRLVRKCTGNRENSGFRQRNYGNFRKGSTASFVAQQMFVKEEPIVSDAERLKRLEFTVQQMDKKMNELDLKLDTILKTLMRPDTPSDI